jgi:hypothetical protein
MGHHDQDPGHGEPGHVHDENWNRHMMETDDPRTDTRDPGGVTTETTNRPDTLIDEDSKDAGTTVTDR